jgi:hypothetical protein
MAKKTIKNSRKPQATFPIRVDVDKEGNFHYTLPNNQLGSTIHPHNNQTVSWQVFVKGRPRPFSIAFSENSPFGSQNYIRSFGKRTEPLPVAVSKYYRGNLCMEYSVSLDNGWTDDPDIVPNPSDSIDPDAVKNPDILLYLNDDGKLTVSNDNAVLDKGVVTWIWKGGTDLGKFTLTFDPKVPHWPPSTDSQGHPNRIDLNLMDTDGVAHAYTIQSENFGETNTCYLTIKK